MPSSHVQINQGETGLVTLAPERPPPTVAFHWETLRRAKLTVPDHLARSPELRRRRTTIGREIKAAIEPVTMRNRMRVDGSFADPAALCDEQDEENCSLRGG